MWIAIPFAFLVPLRPVETLVAWLALSGAALLLERMGPEPIVIERSADPNTGDDTHGMLRPEAPEPNQPAARHADSEGLITSHFCLATASPARLVTACAEADGRRYRATPTTWHRPHC